MNPIKIIILLLIIFISNSKVIYSKCGTHNRLYLNKDSLQTELSNNLKKLNRKLEEVRERRSLLQKFIDTPNGKFRIHYDTSGAEMVPSLDFNKNNIPDYVDSVVYYIEKVYEFEVTQLGFTDPTLKDGEQEFNGGSAAYDIFIRQLGDYKSTVIDTPGYYGMVDQDQIYDTKNSISRYTSYMMIDNDYSSLDSSYKKDGITLKRAYNTFGMEALKVTLAHEFHHSIQMFYTVNEFMTLSEMFSTYMEWRMFPEIKDYIFYTRSLLNGEDYSFLYSLTNTNNGYHFSTFGHYIFKKYGDEFWLEFWEQMGIGKNDFRTLNELLISRNTSLKESWCDYTSWFYYISDKAIEGQFFDDAKLFPKLKYYDDIVFDTLSLNLTLPLRPFSFSFSKVVFSGSDFTSGDTLQIRFVNCDTVNAINYNLNETKRYDFTIVDNYNANSSYIQLGNSKHYYKFDAPNEICSENYFYQGITTELVSTTIPNPYKLNIDDFVIFPCNETIPLFEEVILKIYDLEMGTLYNKNIQVNNYENYRGVILNQNDFKFNSGNYIFSVEYKDKVSLGKFVVKN